MDRILRSRRTVWHLATVLALAIALLTLGAATPVLAGGSGSGSNSGSGSGGSGDSGDSRGSFALAVNLKPPAVGYLVRGGLRLADCPICTTDNEPRYAVLMYGEVFYDSNFVSMVSLDDFQGTVTLEVIGLPSGVTSRTATSAFVPRRGVAIVPLRLEAASTAALGDTTVTLRATSGAIVRTVALPIAIVDRMPTA